MSGCCRCGSRLVSLGCCVYWLGVGRLWLGSLWLF